MGRVRQKNNIKEQASPRQGTQNMIIGTNKLVDEEKGQGSPGIVTQKSMLCNKKSILCKKRRRQS